MSTPYQCSCGCKLQLDIAQQTRENRLWRTRGEGPVVHVNLRTASGNAPSHQASEPTVEMICTGCGAKGRTFQFLVDFAKAHSVRLKCERCAR